MEESRYTVRKNVYYRVHSNKEDTEDLECTSFDNAIRTAKAWSEQEPDAEIEVICVELSTQFMYCYKGGNILY